MICQWDCLKNKSHRVKDFFVRAIAKLLQSQCLDHAKQLIHAITVVALSEAEGNDSSGVPLESEMCKKYLKTQITEDSIIIPAEDTKEAHQVDPFDEIQTDLHGWVSNICEES
ncbi:hypothetical protein XENORESO_019948 [Xenotaenia resolanae]|uniref:Uncharacterized protein n=1 Tax=Xenotaenia resolanae TaxID=208358 RepID=A0ABV0WXL9_9TELE